MQKRYQFQSIFATSRTSRIIESIFEDQKSIFVRVQLEDFQLVLDDFVQAFFSPKSFQAVAAHPCPGSQTSRWLTGTNIEHLFQKAFSKVLLVLVFAPVPELGRVSL